MSQPVHFDFADTLATLEARLVSRLALSELALRPSQRQAEGIHRGQPVTLQARAYAGPGIRWARSVWMHGGGLEIGNLLCLPEADRPWPILGIDLVGLGRETAVAVADLTPTSEDGRLQLAGLARRREGHAPLPSAGELPGWCKAFSPQALFVRVRPDEGPALRAQLLDFVDALAELVPNEPAHPELKQTLRARQNAYLKAHLEDDKGLLLLERVFEAGWARRFLEGVMFPEDPGGGS